MANIWTKRYLLNIDKIDEQHKVFFDLWDKEINQAEPQDHTQLSLVIEKLEDYLKKHIKYEEAILRKSNYKDIESHITQHQFFIQKIDTLKQELTYNNPLLFEKITVFMKKWFLNHIIHTDSKYQETVIAYQKK